MSFDFMNITGGLPEVVELEEEKVKKVGLFDFVKNISSSNKPMEVTREYVPFVIGQAMMQYVDCIFEINTLNKLNVSNKQMHYDFLFYSLHKHSRYAKWAKAEKPEPQTEAILKAIQDKYAMNARRALEYFHHTDEKEITLLKKDYKID